jgi:hypothetical protein
MRTCLCGHDAAEHHLDRRAVYCLGGLEAVKEAVHVFLDHCGCTVYEPAPRETVTA